MPSSQIQFLTLDEVLHIHELVIEAFGGSPGLRDLGMLESAVHRPQTGYYDGLPEMAAALFESLLNNHPFVDGNKRVAFFATDVFLRINGLRMEVDAQEGYHFITTSLSEHSADYARLFAWVRETIRPL